ncbi:hypothetical protein [Planococcus sp. ISL-109]|uniref:hypothetical protein n=1 Tax=Planococcus sp. ISL-109 TaxID=2819166 RepID=UPI001BEAFC99|nr:hypothetical protein [Planococcus sp. ISL-109]MBT2583316.1 hypothetical protein [Planococcus sp. ISL-109]
MKLRERYIYAVLERLPKDRREKAEADLRSKLAERLTDDSTESEERTVLQELGHPALMAEQYGRVRRYLIGPRYFDLYVRLLKLVIPLAVLITLIVVTVVGIVSGIGQDETLFNVLGSLIGNIISAIFNTIMQTLFWITLVVAFMDWADKSGAETPLGLTMEEWTPEDLKQWESQESLLEPVEAKVAKSQIFGSLIWMVIWTTVYFNADKVLGIYTDDGEGLRFQMAIFNQDVLISYWPFVALVIVLELALAIWQWRAGYWNYRLAAFNAAVQTVSVLVFILVFTNSELLNREFSEFLTNTFGGTNALTWIFGGILVIMIAGVLSDIVQGYRRAAKRRSEDMPPQ